MTNEVATVEAQSGMVAMIERLALNPDVDVAKLEKLLEMQERILDRNSKVAYAMALSAMQPKLPVITENGEIKNRDGKVQSTYALWEDINDAIKPILAEHGFALSFKTGYLDKDEIVTCVLTHRDGHSEETSMRLPRDDSGSKNQVQGVGSSISYGKRYTACALLNITSRGEDDDAQSTGRTRDQDKDDSGKPDGWRAQDTRKVTEYKNRILSAINEGADLNAVDIWNEVKDNHEFATALWATLPSPIKKVIRDNK